MTISSAAISSCQSCISNFCDGQGIFQEYGIKSVISYEWPKKGLSLDLLVQQLDQNYQLSGRNNYEKNVELKLLLSKEIQNSNLDLYDTAKWIISSWGGIPKLSKSTHEYVQSAIDQNYPKRLDGVASYSKIFAMFHPDKFAIYDARVAVSLNIIQLLSEETEAIFFPYLSGRNKITGYQITNQGFSRMPEFSRRKISETSQQSWNTIGRKHIYPLYNQILNSVCATKNLNLYDVEMLLFSKAEELVLHIRSYSKFDNLDWSRIPN